MENAIRRLITTLRTAGVESPRLDAELIVARALDCKRLDLYAAPERQLNADRWAECLAMAQRRAAREPLAYILGTQEFYGLDFEVAPGVLIPRPETELIVERALSWLEDWPAERDRVAREPLALDLGTGSGCIAVACAREQAERGLAGSWIATDVSEAALEIARTNARNHGVDARIEFRKGSFFEPLESPVDLICANPPYVARESAAELQPEVREWEPEAALFAADSGLAHARRILADAPRYLAPGGTLLMEIGAGQKDAIAEIVGQGGDRGGGKPDGPTAAQIVGDSVGDTAGDAMGDNVGQAGGSIGDRACDFSGAVFHHDLAGIPRVLEVRRR